MRTEVLAVLPDRPDAGVIARAAAVLHAGGLVAFPTETVYGLGANALDAEAVSKIFIAKGRPPINPVIVHVGDVRQVGDLVADWPEAATQLAARFWPGPLTLVLAKQPRIPDAVTAGGPTVGVRMPAHPVALALLHAAYLPVAAPSANRSAGLSPTRAEHVLKDLDGRIDLVLDAGPTPGGLESTVLDLTCRPPRLLRPGLVSVAQLEAVVGAVDRSQTRETGSETPLASPGLMTRHYSPRTPLECVDRKRIGDLRSTGRRLGLLAFGRIEFKPPLEWVVISMPESAEEYSARLYAVLHEMDERGLERILVEMPPDEPAWLAVRDRLRRAAAVEFPPR